MTRDQLLAAATVIHDEQGCTCDRKYLMSCWRMAVAIVGLASRTPADNPEG
ncbi:hypothetical protein AB0F72_08390 [Actinoplanes sp. NPDC023936]|uniref:hypothetical protein n=1 Tax=Actinoplanes sp. NPDC023936 TaxID=3154910 RepID=UPI0033F7DC17